MGAPSSSSALGGSDAVFPVTDVAGKQAKAQAVVIVGESGGEASQVSYSLASGATLAPQAGTSPVASIRRGTYVWDAQWTGAGTMRLQVLGSDNATWRTLAELTSPGAYGADVRVGANSTMRLFNTNQAGGTTFTAISSSLT